MSTATEHTAMVEIPFDLLTTITSLAAEARDHPAGAYEAHEVRDALAELYKELDAIELRVEKQWGISGDRRSAFGSAKVHDLLERARQRMIDRWQGSTS